MEQIGLFLLLGGLLIFTLVMASLVRQYQERMAEKRLRLQRIIREVDVIEQLLKQCADCSLPSEIKKLLHEDVLSRLQLVQQIDGRFQGIDRMIKEAELALNQQQAGQREVAWDYSQLQNIIAVLGQLMSFLKEGRLLKALTPDQIRSYVGQLGTLRAEYVYGFHLQRANRFLQAGKLHNALGDYKSIKSFLSEHGPDNEQVKTWYAEAEALRKALSEKIASDG